MKTTVNVYDFHSAFKCANRAESFSDAALNVLFDYFEEYEESTGEEIELDVIAICCEYSEDTWENIADSYSIILDDIIEEDEEVKMERVKEYLEEHGVLVGEVEGGFVYRDF